MTTTDLNKQKTGVGTEKIEGTSSEKELVANLSETPLTVEQQVVKLRGEVKNLNAGIFELLELFKEVLKKQVSTESMIEKNIAATTEVSQKVNNGMIRMNEAMDNKLKNIHEKMDKNSKNIKEQLEDMDQDIIYIAREHASNKFSRARDRPRSKYN